MGKSLRFMAGQMQQRIRERLSEGFAPAVLEITNESYMHSRGTETHFNVLIVAEKFRGLSKIKQHQLVYSELGPIMSEIHALTTRCHGTLPEKPKQG